MPDVTAKVNEAKKSIDLEKNNYVVELDTTKGPIRLQFLTDLAPGHVKNFIALAKIGFYDGVGFHRVISGFMIQGGCPLGTGTGDGGYKIPAEFNKTKHEPGVLSMARSSDPDSGGTQFFIVLEKSTHLDNNYTAFGRTVDQASLDVVRAIGKVDVDRNDKPKVKVVINKATVTETPK